MTTFRVMGRDATREDFLAAIATWERGGNVTGHYALALYRYWKGEGPSIESQRAVDDFEYVRRALEVPKPVAREDARIHTATCEEKSPGAV